MGTVTTGSFSEIQSDLGGSNPIGLNEYYRAGSYMPNTSNNSGVPKSGAISVANISSVDGGTGANSTAYNSNPYITINKQTDNFTGQELSSSCAFTLSVNTQGYSTADGDGNTPSNTGVSWSGSGVSFSSTTATTTTATITSSGSYSSGVSYTVTLSGNGTSAQVSLASTTRAEDTDPVCSPTSTSSSGVNPSTSNTSSGCTISGLDSGTSVSTSFSGTGQYKINSGSWTTGTSSVSNGDVIYINMTSSGSYSTGLTGTVTVGSHGDTFGYTVTTRALDTSQTDTTVGGDVSAYGQALSTRTNIGSHTLGGVDSGVTAIYTASGSGDVDGASSQTTTTSGTRNFYITTGSSANTTYNTTITGSGTAGWSDSTQSASYKTGDQGHAESETDDKSYSAITEGSSCNIIHCNASLNTWFSFKWFNSSSAYSIRQYQTTSGGQYTSGFTAGWSNIHSYWASTSYAHIGVGDTLRVKIVYSTSGNGWMSNTFYNGTSSGGLGGSWSSGTWTSNTWTHAGGSDNDIIPNSSTQLNNWSYVPGVATAGQAQAICGFSGNPVIQERSFYAASRIYLENVSGTYIIPVTSTQQTTSVHMEAGNYLTGPGACC